MLNDLGYAIRTLLKTPGFTAVAVVSLALGIGANTAIFSALNGVLLRSLPVRNPDELRLVNWMGHNPQYSGYSGPGTIGVPGGLTVGTSFSYAAYCALRDRGKDFGDLFLFSSPRSAILAGHGQPALASAVLVSGNFFSAYGADVLIGRPILPDDDRFGAPPVAVITHRWWEEHCGLNPNVIGQPLSINKSSFTVIGVLPAYHLGPTTGDSSDVYVPISSYPQLFPSQPLESSDQWQIMARMAPGVADAPAQASLSLVFRQAQGISKTKMDDAGIVLEDGSRGQLILRRELARPFYVLAAIVGVVLLIACANLAGLLLARGAARQHELAVRAALGAGRWRLIAQSLMESLLLSLGGAIVGLGVAAVGKPMLIGFLGVFSLENSRFDLSTDGRVVGFTLGMSLLTALLFGMLPALRASRADPALALRNRSATGTARLMLGRVLVAVQVGLSVLLVIGAGLMARTFTNLARVQPGFNPDNLLQFRIRATDGGYSAQQAVDVLDRIRAALATLPGVRAVSFSNVALVSGSTSSDVIELPGREGQAGQKVMTHYLPVGCDFFRTMEIPILLGRDLSAADNASGPSVAVVNEMFARRYFSGESPIGRTFKMDGPSRTIEIVGVARDTKYYRLREEIVPAIFFPHAQSPTRGVTFSVRSAVPPFSLLPAVRQAVAAIDPNLPISTIRTQQQVLDQSVQSDRLFASLGGALALLAVLLSCIGLYGLMAYNVTRRVPEIGVRIALGATRGKIAGPILREAMILSTLGLLIGVPVAIALTRLIRSQLYGVSPTDPLTLTIAGALLTAVALLAAWIPARRAARIDPMVALRSE